MADLIGLLLRLSRAGVDAVLVGGLAAAAHGTSLVTQDLETIRQFEEIERLASE